MSFRHVTQPHASRLRVLNPISPFPKPWHHRTSFSAALNSGALNRDTDPTPDEIQAENEHRQRIGELQERDQEYLNLILGTTADMLSDIENAREVAKDLQPGSAHIGGTLSGIPPYTLVRDYEHTLKVYGEFEETIKTLRRHMRDLRAEPYPDRSHSKLHTWTEKMLGWTEEKKRAELNELRMKAEARGKNLRDSVEQLMDLAKRPDGSLVEKPSFNGNGAQGRSRRSERREGAVIRAADRSGKRRGRDEKDAGGEEEVRAPPSLEAIQEMLDNRHVSR